MSRNLISDEVFARQTPEAQSIIRLLLAELADAMDGIEVMTVRWQTSRPRLPH